MALVGLLLRVVLAAVLIVAGVAKARDRDRTYAAARGFGLPVRAAAVTAALLPAVELLVAAALLPPLTARSGALAALVLLAAFTVAVAVAVARGSQVACSCFGARDDRPVSARTLLRNGVLLVAAGTVALAPATGPAAAVAGLRPGPTAIVLGFAVLAAVAGLQAWWIGQLLRQHGRALQRLAALEAATGVAAPGGAAETGQAAVLGLTVGAPAPAFRLTTTAGGEVELAELLADGPVVLAFTAPRCDACTELLPDLAAPAEPGRPRVVVIGAGPAAANAAKAREGGLDRILLDPRRKVAEAYAAPGTPAAVLVSADGRIASPVALGVDPVRSLVRGRPASTPRRPRACPRTRARPRPGRAPHHPRHRHRGAGDHAARAERRRGRRRRGQRPAHAAAVLRPRLRVLPEDAA